MRISTLFLISVLFIVAFASSNFAKTTIPINNLLWTKHLVATKGNVEITSSTIMDDGNVILIGIFDGKISFEKDNKKSTLTSKGDNDIFIEKISKNGNLIWVNQLGGKENDRTNEVCKDKKGNLYITGYFKSTLSFKNQPKKTSIKSKGEADVFVLKLDKYGEFEWLKSMGSKGFDEGSSITTNENGIYVTGFFEDNLIAEINKKNVSLTADNGYDAFVVSLGFDGKFKWIKQFKGSGYEKGCSIKSLNSYLVIGISYSDLLNLDVDNNPDCVENSNGGADLALVKLTSDGKFIWGKRLGGNNDDFLSGIAIDENKNIFMYGTFKNNAAYLIADDTIKNLKLTEKFDGFIHKFSEDGDILWSEKIGGPDNDYCDKFIINSTRIVASISYNNKTALHVEKDNLKQLYELQSKGKDDFILAQLDANNGTPNKLLLEYGTPNSDFCSSLIFDKSGNIYSSSQQFNKAGNRFSKTFFPLKSYRKFSTITKLNLSNNE